MDPQREPQRPTSAKPNLQKPYQTKPPKTYLPTKKNYSQEVSVLMGAAFILLSLLGFVVDHLFGAHLSYTHNFIHFVTGGLALWFGFSNIKNAKVFNYVAGSIYGMAGLLGFVVGSPGMATVGTIAQDSFLWKVIPQTLELGTNDHIMHILFGTIFITAAFINIKKFKRI